MISFENTAVAFQSKDDGSLRRMQLLFKMMSMERLVGLGSSLLNFSLRMNLPVKALIRNTLFNQFCGGENIKDCDQRIKELNEYNIKTILDYSVEGKESEEDFERNKNEIIATIRRAENDTSIPFSVFKVTGIARFKILEKAANKSKMTESEVAAFQAIVGRVEAICKEGFERKVPVFIDAEESWIQQAIDEIAFDMMLKFNREQAVIYNTVQLYRKDRLAYLMSLHEKAKQQGIKVGVKLVRGAYMEKERERAKTKGYPSPIQNNKSDTDKDFDLASTYCLENLQDISICCGSHNEKSNLLLTELMEKKGIKAGDKRVYFAQLLGMSDHISYNLSSAGYNVAKYVPYGPIKEVMPYLIRRAEENTSIAGQTGRELTLIQKELKRRKG